MSVFTVYLPGQVFGPAWSPSREWSGSAGWSPCYRSQSPVERMLVVGNRPLYWSQSTVHWSTGDELWPLSQWCPGSLLPPLSRGWHWVGMSGICCKNVNNNKLQMIMNICCLHMWRNVLAEWRVYILLQIHVYREITYMMYFDSLLFAREVIMTSASYLGRGMSSANPVPCRSPEKISRYINFPFITKSTLYLTSAYIFLIQTLSCLWH